jgi:K+-transporting ATPase KdpF subunit
MSGMYILGGIVAGLLCLYLFCALLKPEWFE